MVEHVVEQAQPELKEAEVHSRGPVKLAIPAVVQALRAKINHPQVRQRNSHQKPGEPLRSRNMAFVDVEASALLIREQRFDLIAFRFESAADRDESPLRRIQVS